MHLRTPGVTQIQMEVVRKTFNVVSTEPAESTVRDDPASYMHKIQEH